MNVRGHLFVILVKLLILAAGCATFFAVAVRVCPYPEEALAPSTQVSRRYMDRNGRDLRVTVTAEGSRALWCEAEAMGPWIAAATVAIEDHRFASHPGVDVVGITRAAGRNVVFGGVREGGSTVTQQLARLIRPELRRLPGWRRKLHEWWDAVRIERQISKSEILVQYLNRAPYGNRVTGIAAAAALYFGKTPDRLTLAEAALLAGVPQAPDRLSPYRRPELARARQKRILNRMRDLGYITAIDHERATAEKLVFRAPRPVYHAPHFLAALEAGHAGILPEETTEVTTTIDLDLQTEVEELLRSHLVELADAPSNADIRVGGGTASNPGAARASEAAAVVLDARSGAILAWAGSRDFFHSSQVDGVTALRQPGSTLKPFTYALALEDGMTPADLIADIPIDDNPDGYRPENFDRSHHGAVRLREALACSYNIPAVRVLRDRVGPERLLALLREAGCSSLNRDAAHYGLALTLGAGEIRLLDLAAAYAMLARGGTSIKPHGIGIGDDVVDASSGRPLLSRDAAAQITSILSDDAARSPAFGDGGPLAFSFPAAAKTGTSKDFRDNWAVGYTPRHVVAVWVGNFDGAPMRGVSGVTGAGPLMHAILEQVGANDGPFEAPSGLARARVCPLSGMMPGAACPDGIEEWFRPGTEPADVCTFHRARDGRTIVEIPAGFRTDGFRMM
jgi:penicillin-binding protein 1C